MGRAARIASVFTRRLASGLVRSRLGTSPTARAELARQTRLAFEELGPGFVKLGQLVSVRPDIFGADLVFEMAKLRDSAPPMALEAVERQITRSLGGGPDRVFASFDPEPIASASVAQVHTATLREDYRPVWGEALPGGAKLAVKVLREDAARLMAEDLGAAGALLGALRRVGLLRGSGADALLEESARSLASETDLRNEGRSADRFAFDFRDDPLVFAPRVVWPLSGPAVLSMEHVEGWPVCLPDAAARAGVDSRRLAIHGAHAFMRQVLELGRFHADLHPANVFVTPDGRISYLDFGIVGELPRDEREAVAEVLAGIVYGDADRALRHSARLGVAVPPHKVPKLTRDVAALMERTMGSGGRDVRHFGLGLLRLLSSSGVAVPVGYGLLVKALVTVEGVARSVHPDVDIMETARPFVTALLARRALEPARMLERLPDAIDAAIRVLADAGQAS